MENFHYYLCRQLKGGGMEIKVKKRIWICVCILLLLLSFNLTFHYFYNEHMIEKYNHQEYSLGGNPLLFCNWFQPYVAHYNMGNIYYQNEEYADAMYEYQRALDANPGKGKECSVRINLALAILKTMETDYDSEENVEDSLEKLREARSVLLEEDCATEAGDGHSETAEELKCEIDEMIQKLEENQEAEYDNHAPQDDTESEEAEDAYEKEIKETLQEQQADSYEERTQALQEQEDLNSDTLFDWNEFIW